MGQIRDFEERGNLFRETWVKIKVSISRAFYRAGCGIRRLLGRE